MTLPSLRIPVREALELLDAAEAAAAIADREYESANAASTAYHAWEAAVAESLNRIFSDENASKSFRSRMNVLGGSRRASSMFEDRREKLLAVQAELLLNDFQDQRAELLAKARQTQSHDAMLLLQVRDAEKILTRQIHEGERLFDSLPSPEAMNDRAYRDASAKEIAYRNFNVQLLRTIFDRNDVAEMFDRATTPFEFHISKEKIDWENCRKIPIEHGTDPKEIVVRRIRRQVEELIRWRDKLPVTARIGSPVSMVERTKVAGDNRVFLVHGHDTAILQEVARLLEKLGFAPIILAERPNAGRTLIEKLEAHAGVQFAIVLATADDVGSKATAEEQRSRARQNVIFELGFFVGRLGRDKVALLLEPAIEIPSDLHGVAYHHIDAHGAWRLALAKELKAAGLSVDFNRLA